MELLAFGLVSRPRSCLRTYESTLFKYIGY
uniref:Uncharacterized protein n=1 Tax=Arundo donax TaxID=35708 RepID=A0A0A8XVC0_ARUDO